MKLHVTSPLMRGPEVLEAQMLLARLGFAPGPVDGVYGPTTAAAVSAFEKSRGQDADGALATETIAGLRAATMADSVAATRRPASPIGLNAILEAIRHIGKKEDPPGSNRTSFGVWFGIDGVPWCNIFVSHCFQVGAAYTICEGFIGAGIRAGKGCAYVPTTEAWLRTSGLWVGRTEPQPGDIAIFNWGGGAADHIGIVELSLGDGRFQTIEGNTSANNDSNGGEVMRRQRTLMQAAGFGRIT